MSYMPSNISSSKPPCSSRESSESVPTCIYSLTATNSVAAGAFLVEAFLVEAFLVEAFLVEAFFLSASSAGVVEAFSVEAFLGEEFLVDASFLSASSAGASSLVLVLAFIFLVVVVVMMPVAVFVDALFAGLATADEDSPEAGVFLACLFSRSLSSAVGLSAPALACKTSFLVAAADVAR